MPSQIQPRAGLEELPRTQGFADGTRDRIHMQSPIRSPAPLGSPYPHRTAGSYLCVPECGLQTKKASPFIPCMLSKKKESDHGQQTATGSAVSVPSIPFLYNSWFRAEGTGKLRCHENKGALYHICAKSVQVSWREAGTLNLK